MLDNEKLFSVFLPLNESGWFSLGRIARESRESLTDKHLSLLAASPSTSPLFRPIQKPAIVGPPPARRLLGPAVSSPRPPPSVHTVQPTVISKPSCTHHEGTHKDRRCLGNILKGKQESNSPGTYAIGVKSVLLMSSLLGNKM